jgi:hypothetical protein
MVSFRKFDLSQVRLAVIPPEDQTNDGAEHGGAEYEWTRDGDHKPGNDDQPERNNCSSTGPGYGQVAKSTEGRGPLSFHSSRRKSYLPAGSLGSFKSANRGFRHKK